jgi:hypothetical protein
LALPLYFRRLKAPLLNDVARLLDVSGLWVRNVGDRRQTKRNTLQIIRRIISRLKIPAKGPVADAIYRRRRASHVRSGSGDRRQMPMMRR